MRLSLINRFSFAAGAAVLATAAAIGYTATVQAGPSIRTVQLRDDCDPPSFNLVLTDPRKPNAPTPCIGDGDTTFTDFIDEFTAQGSVDKWRFNPDRSEADRAVNAQNRGGEFHTFTEVKQFGAGFVPPLNGGADPIAECAKREPDGTLSVDEFGDLVPAAEAAASFVPPGVTTTATALAKGTHKFQCCIHPWMKSIITIK